MTISTIKTNRAMLVREKGTITHLLPEVTGTSKTTGNPYTIREFVIEVNDEGYKSLVHFKAINGKAEELHDAVVGDIVEVSYKPSSREHNGRWYDENRLLHVNVIRQPAANAQASAPVQEPVDNDLPF